MTDRVTLKSIAAALGVTTTTVHRALQGKDGVSEETGRRIRQAAEDMGYRANYMAAALKRKEIRLAAALPEPSGDSRYYYGGMWQGLRRFLREVAEFHVTPLEYTYTFVHGAHGNALKAIYDRHDRLDGLLTVGVDQGQSSYYIQKFKERGVPIVLLGSDMYRDARLCCVRAYDEMAGSLAAELLTAFDGERSPKEVVVVGHFGQLGTTDQLLNVKGFEEYLRQYAPHITPRYIRNEDHAVWSSNLEQALTRGALPCAAYSCSARYTVYLVEFLEKFGLAGKLKVIGSDLFDESAAFLQRGALNALIDKKIARQSYLAAKTLFDFAVKNEFPRSDCLHIRPEVMLRKSISIGKRIVPGEDSPFDDILIPP